MGRSQDYMSHYYDDMFDDDYIEEQKRKSEKIRLQEEKERRRRESIASLTTDPPLRMLPILGCILGDFVGSRFEHDYPEFEDLGDYEFIHPDCTFTDDTVFTLGIAEAFAHSTPSPQAFTESLIKWGRSYPNAGYGRSTKAWIASDAPKPYGSNRNGAAMRVAPCACFASDLGEALKYAKISAEVSHNDPEGVAGAQAIAAAIYLALDGATKNYIKAYVELCFGYDLNLDMEQLRRSWSGFSCKAVDTVPQAIICFLQSHDVESAIRNAISLCSDADTLAAMAAAIAAPFYGQLPYIKECLNRLPDEIISALLQCSTYSANHRNTN